MLAERQQAIPDEKLCDELATAMLGAPATPYPPVPAQLPAPEPVTDADGLFVLPKSDPPPVIRRRGRPRKSTG